MIEFFRFLFSCLQAGLVTFGGGVAFIPVLHGLFVTDNHFISDANFQRIVVYASSTPGPIAPLITGYVGIISFGSKGMLLGILALILPTTLLILYIYPLFVQYKKHPILQHVNMYIKPLLIFMFLFLLITQLQFLFPFSKLHPIHTLILLTINILGFRVFKLQSLWILMIVFLYTFLFIL